MIQEVIVTAQKRSEKIEDVPITVQVVTAEKLGPAGVSNLRELPLLVPGLRVDLLGAHMQPTIRGITSSSAGPGSSTNVALYMDGFYIPSQYGGAFDLPNVESINVVKGPQGTLFGRNATGGAIIVNTYVPSFTPTLRAEATYASFNDKRLSVYGATGVTDKLAVDLAAYWRESDGFVKNIATGGRDASSKHLSFRPKVLFKPTDEVTFTLSYEHSEIKEPGGQAYALLPDYAAGASANSVPGALTTINRREDAQNLKALGSSRTDALYLKSEFDLGWATLASYTGYRKERAKIASDLDGSTTTFFEGEWHQGDKTFTQEANLTSNGSGPLKWTVGAFYFDDEARLPDFLLHFCAGCSLNYLDADLKTSAWAAYADATYNITGGLYATAGVRYSDEKQTYDYTSLGTVGRGEQSWTNTSPRVALRYEFSPRTNVYASFSKGFRAGAFNTYEPNPKAVNPETVDAYETGFKAATGTWHFATAAFFYDYKDLQVTAYSGATTVASLQNAATARIKGLEGEAYGEVAPNLTVHANLAYTHGRYKDFSAAQDFVPNGPGAGYSLVAVDASGKQMIRTPTWTGNVGANYDINTSEGLVTLAGDVSVTSKIAYDAPNRFVQGGYAILNLSATWAAPGDHWGVTVFGKNVTDTKYWNYIDPVSNAILVNWGTPANYGVTLRYKY